MLATAARAAAPSQFPNFPDAPCETLSGALELGEDPTMPHRFTEFWRNDGVRKWMIWGSAALVVYLLVGFFLVPALLKWQLLKQLPPATHRLASVRQVKFNPLALSLTVRGLGLVETNGQPFVSFDEFYANFQLSSLFRFAWTFDKISLVSPRAEIVLGQDGRFNFADLLGPSDNAPPKAETNAPGGLPRLLIFNLSVTNGQAGFADLSRKTPFRTVYNPINLDLRGFTTRRDRHTPYSFNASGDGGRSISWSGTVSAQPLGSSGSLSIHGAQLPVHSPYIEHITRARLTGGALDIAGNYAFGITTNGTDLVASNLVLTLAALELEDPGTGEVVLEMPSFAVKDASFDLRRRHALVGSISMNEPKALVRRHADGSINLASLLVAPAPDAAPPPTDTSPDSPVEQPWVFELADYQLNGGAVQFEDAAVPGPFRSLLKPVTIRVQHFSTVPNTRADIHAEITTEAGEGLNVAAEYSIKPEHATGKVELTGLELKKYQPYLAPFFRGILTDGTADAALAFSQSMSGDVLQATVTNAGARVSDLTIQDPDNAETVVRVASFAVENTSGDLGEKALRIGSISSSTVEINARRETNGEFNLLSLMAAGTISVTSSNAVRVSDESAGNALMIDTNAAPPSAQAAWRVVLDELKFRDWAVHFTDQQLPNPGKLDLEQLTLSLAGVQFPSNAPVAVELSMRVNGAGTIATHGDIHPYSPAVNAEIKIADLSLREFQPWIEQQVKVGIERGALSLIGRVELAQPENGGWKGNFTGNVGVTDFATVDQLLFKEFVRWEELEVAEIDVRLQPNSAAVGLVRFAGLQTSLIISSNKTPNFLSVLPDRTATSEDREPAPSTEAAPALPAATVQTPSTQTGSAPFPLQLGEFRLEKAAIHFGDQSVQPPCAFDLRHLEGTVKGLSTNPDSTADVDISGQVDEGSPFGLRGRVNPLASDLTLDLVFTNHNLQLTSFTPYMEKFVGHPLNKGRLSLDLNYAIQGKQLMAKNSVEIDQLMLGPRNDNPDAAKLPVKLAVALLKDMDGRINLDVPLEGRLDDPGFKIGPVIFKVLGNLIVKAAASPFKLIGSLVGGGEELSFVEFEHGQALFVGAETNKLDKLVAALEKRPALSLEIEGSIDPAVDRDALARARVRERIKAARLRELSEIGRAPPSADEFVLEPVEYERLLRAAVVDTFGADLTEAVRAVAERAAAAATNSAALREGPKGPGLLTRMASLFKPKNERAAIVQAHRASKADTLLREENPALASLSAADMESLLATKTETPEAELRSLMESRAKAVQAYLLSSGSVSAERLFLVAPKAVDAAYKGEAKANLYLN